MTPGEAPKRLAPTRDTLRELFLKSGNQCAFPGCNRSMIDADGNLVGQICHIEAAEPGGERFNPNQTNDQRRGAANLLLMCYEHHVATDNVDLFPVERMRRIKEEHEKKFSDVVGSILSSVVDHTTLNLAVKPRTLNLMNTVIGWGLTPVELRPMAEEISAIADRLAKLPHPVRSLFEIIVRRATTTDGSRRRDLLLPWPEVQQATNLDPGELYDLLSTLERYEFSVLSGDDGYEAPTIVVPTPLSGWPVWSDTRKFCDAVGVPVSQIVINLDFSVLD